MQIILKLVHLKGAVELKRLCYLKKKIISLVIYIFRGHVRAHTKDNEMLFEIIVSEYRKRDLMVQKLN